MLYIAVTQSLPFAIYGTTVAAAQQGIIGKDVIFEDKKWKHAPEGTDIFLDNYYN